MKKRLLSALLALFMALALLPKTTWGADIPAVGTASLAAAQTAEEDLYDAVEIYLENRKVWMKTKGLSSLTSNFYGLLDFEGDGIPELFLSEFGGTGFFSSNHYYKIDVDTRSVYEMQDLPDRLNSIDITYGLKMYSDNQTGQLLYYYKDFIRNGYQYSGTNYGIFYEKNNTVVSRSLWAEEREVVNNSEQYTYSYYSSGDEWVEVSKEEWDRYQENYFNQYTLIAEDVPTYGAEELNRANDAELRKILRDLYDELYQLKLDPVDYLAFSDLCYHESGTSSVGKTVRDMIGSQWDSKWKETDILYSELYANIESWIVYDYRSYLGTGFAAYAFKHPLRSKIVIAYRGSHDAMDVQSPDWGTDWLFNDLDWLMDWILNDGMMFIGGRGTQLQNALDFYDDVYTVSGCENISVTGHSLGGGLADIVAARYGCEGQSFNSAPFLDVAYWYRCAEMSEYFAGVDQFTFWAHVNVKDVVGNWIGESIKPKVLYDPIQHTYYDNLGLTGKVIYNHLLPSMITRDGDGNVCMGEGEQKTRPKKIKQRAVAYKNIADYVSLGTSGEDKLIYILIGPSYAVYGGNGDDVIQTSISCDVISGGKGNDYLDGTRGNDTYIYHQGDGHDVIHDISGKDELVLYGFPDNSNITTTVVDKYVRISVNNSAVADISTIRSSKKDNSFVVRLDGSDEALEINDLLRGKVKHAKSISVSCPVNVEVIDDATGAVVHTLRDGQEGTSYTQYGNFYVYPDENGEYIKYLDLFEGYSVRIVGVGNGTMGIFVQDINDDPYDPDPFVAEGIPVTENMVAVIDENAGTGEKTLLIDTDGDGTADTTLPLTEKDLCAEGHQWGRGVLTAESEAVILYTCSICGETRYEDAAQPAPKTTYTITVNASPAAGGSVSGGGDYDGGASVTVKAAANSGYRFVCWTEDGATVSTDESYTFTVEADRTLTAVYGRTDSSMDSGIFIAIGAAIFLIMLLVVRYFNIIW